MSDFLYVGVGGFFGANARYFLSAKVGTWLANMFNWSLPFGTLFVNVTGSFLLAIFLVWTSHKIDVPTNLQLLIATGFFGAYTTFSTYANESVALIRAGDWAGGISNIVLSNGLCILGVLLGIFVAERLFAASV